MPNPNLITADSVALVGVLNVTPDSFSDGGNYSNIHAAIDKAKRLCAAGAHIIDVGGESTRPGATPVPTDVETARVLPIVKALVGQGIPVSVDTMHADTAMAAVASGAVIVNDVSGGLADANMFRALASLDCQVVLGHLRGTPATMQSLAGYTDVVAEVVSELEHQARLAESAGISPDRIVVDPGVGFAKDTAQSWAVVQSLMLLKSLGYPVMIGVSRKRFLAPLLAEGAAVLDRDLPTAVLSALLADAGANALRVHNVAATSIAIRTHHAARPQHSSLQLADALGAR